jgi:hypothetical protein|nr:hypothetical protein [Allomuricauda sp.]|tara:strand:- start:2214 stop:2558 length:345 start_codon:yes stop_codon:yes gene_type:complete
MSTIFDTTSKMVDRSKELVARTFEYYQLKAFAQVSYLLSTFLKIVVIGGLLGIGLIFLMVALSIYLGAVLNSLALGYCLVGLFMFLVTMVLYWKRKFIENLVVRKFSKNFFSDD